MKSVPEGRRHVKGTVGGIPLPSGFWLVYLTYNGLVFLLYAVDKGKAARGSRRIPEATLLWAALLGGAAGAALGIYLVRHKTKKPLFALGVPLMLAAQGALAFYLWQRAWP